MKLSPLDWYIIIGYCVLALAIGVYFSRRAGGSIGEFFLSGRNLPWWLAGTSMVATTFAADTPLAVTELVRTEGIFGNWYWWGGAMGGMLATFFFARLWRRAEVFTDIELIELRYDGRSAAALRGFQAIYSGIILNSIVMGWVISAMGEIVRVSLGTEAWFPSLVQRFEQFTGITVPPEFEADKWVIIIILILIATIYSIMSGLWGVIATDLIQFSMAMIGSIVLAILAVREVGGVGALAERLAGADGSALRAKAALFPEFTTETIVMTFIVWVGVQWWASGRPDGSAYIAQRMLATKDEKHSLLSALWFNIAHYVLRPWPWVLVGLISLIMLPNLESARQAYPEMMVKLLPSGLLGLMVASLLAAFMSTIDTQVNYGASYIVNDFYKRFVNPDASDRHYVAVSRIAVGLLAVSGAVVASQIESISDTWKFLTAIGGGTGLVSILRWYWWRVNAWSEITAMAASLITASIIFLFTPYGDNAHYGHRIIIVFLCATAAWLIVTYLTQPVGEKKLLTFYRKVRPGRALWGPIADMIEADDSSEKRRSSLLGNLINWVLGVATIYCSLFGLGNLLLGRPKIGLLLLAISIVAGYSIYRNLTTDSPQKMF